MCISIARANFSTTKVYVGEAQRHGRYVHVVAYQNNADSQVAWEPNAMILPFPTQAKMGRDNIIDTSSFSGFLNDITDPSKLQSKMLGSSRGLTPAPYHHPLVFNSASYTSIFA